MIDCLTQAGPSPDVRKSSAEALFKWTAGHAGEPEPPGKGGRRSPWTMVLNSSCQGHCAGRCKLSSRESVVSRPARSRTAVRRDRTWQTVALRGSVTSQARDPFVPFGEAVDSCPARWHSRQVNMLAHPQREPGQALRSGSPILWLTQFPRPQR